jgi:adenine/guanine phosphoribosyltransferase-like PRPP-binding protein
LIQDCAKALARKMEGITYDVLVTAESKSIPLSHAFAMETHKPYFVLRNIYRACMGNTIHAETKSITEAPGEKNTFNILWGM